MMSGTPFSLTAAASSRSSREAPNAQIRFNQRFRPEAVSVYFDRLRSLL
jgi:hypothetical protein